MATAVSLVSRRHLLGAALSLPALVGLPACGGGGDEAAADVRFAFDGLPGRTVRRLRPSGDGLLAATDDGAWRRAPGAAGWQQVGLAGLALRDVAPLGATHWLASASTVTGAPALLETLDAGAHWSELVHDFGGTVGGPGAEPVQALVHDAAGARLLATGYDVLAQSTDGGRHWQRLAGDWQGFAHPKDALAFHPGSGDVWFGGQDAIEGLALYRHRHAGGALDRYPNLMPSPSTAKGIRFSIDQPQRVFVSGEGGIVQTHDDGSTWRPLRLHPDHRFYFDLLQDPQRPQRLITAGWAKEFDLPQPLVLEWSDDDGASWHSVQHPDRQIYGGVWSLALQIEGGRSVAYLGLFRGGVMRVEIA